MRNSLFRECKFIRLALVWIVFSALCFPAAAQVEEMSADEVLKEADFLLNAGRAVDAIPYLKSYLERTAGVEDARIRSMAQDVRFKLGTVYIQENKLSVANQLLETYAGLRPAPRWNQVMKLWSTGLFELGDFETCVQVTTNALSGPPADVLAELNAAAALAAATAAEEAEKSDVPEGYMENEYGEIVEIPEGAEVAWKDDPTVYSIADLLILNMTLGNAYHELGKDDLAIEPFTYVIEYTANDTHKGYAIMQVVNGLIEEKNFERLTLWIPQLYRTDARYDIRVNIALMKAATALFDAGEYDNALPLYRMILPRGELIAHHALRIYELQLEAGIVTLAQIPTEYRVQIDETLFGRRETVVAVEEFWAEGDRNNADLNKTPELIELEQLVKTLQELPPYENEVLYRNAYLYDAVTRPWEAVRFFDRVYNDDPDGNLGERSFYEVIRLLLDPLDQRAEAEQRGFAFLKAKNEGMLPRQVAYLLTGYYQQNKLLPESKILLPYIENFAPSSDSSILKYDCELYYMQAIADLVMMEYEQAEAAFKKVLTAFPGSHQEDNASYWHALSLMYLQKYEGALAEFEAYPKKFPKGTWLASAAFQSGTCLFGLEKYDEAKIRFTTVIDHHSDSPVFPDACSLRGDIYGSEGMLDEAVLDYQTAIATARNEKQAKYATFQMANVFEAEDRYDEIILAVDDYLTRYGDEAEIALGIFWIGKTKVNQGLIDEAVQSYFEAIVQYGGDLEQGGVDSMIAELVKLSRIRLSSAQRAELRSGANAVIAQTDSLTLQLRLRAMLAEIDRTEIELGKQLIAELPDLGNAAPPVLSVISKASFELEDYSRAEEILEVFVKQFADSEFMRPAFRLRGFELFKAGEYDEALKLIADAQGRYGTDYDVAWAQLMKGEIQIRQGNFDEAVETLTAVLNVTGWRGESYAEATVRLGQAEEAAGNLLKAHGWYQRAYVQYKGYDGGKWAADAYLGSARCLKELGYTQEAHNTYRAMLFDKYINTTPQAEQAQKAVGADEVLEISQFIQNGGKTNLTISVEQQEGDES